MTSTVLKYYMKYMLTDVHVCDKKGTSGHSNLTTGRIAATHARFNDILDPIKYVVLGATRILNPNGISIGSAVFAGLTSVTDRQNDRPRYSVCK